MDDNDSAETQRLARALVLIVEDDEDTRGVLQLALECEGYVVETACNGRDGIEKLRLGPRPDVLVTDLCMPVMSGQELIATKARESSALASIPVIVMSAIARLAAPAGAAAVLPKPLDLDRLFEALERVCPAATSSSSAAAG